MIDWLWAGLSFILVSAGLGGHMWRFIVTINDPTSDDKVRVVLATCAMCLYGYAYFISSFQSLWAPAIAIAGPAVGLTYVLVAKALGHSIKVDRFQIVLGVFQLIGSVLGAIILCWSL